MRGALASISTKFCRLASVGLGTIMAIALSASAAQSVPVIVENYWEESIQQLCISTSFCAFDFSRVPITRTLIVTNVSCGFSLTSTSTGFSFVDLIKRSTAGDIINTPKIDLFPGKKGEIATTVQFWAITNQVSHIVRERQRARIEATVVSGVYYGGYYQSCTVIGILKP
jgi:hypothetical protein